MPSVSVTAIQLLANRSKSENIGISSPSRSLPNKVPFNPVLDRTLVLMNGLGLMSPITIQVWNSPDSGLHYEPEPEPRSSDGA